MRVIKIKGRKVLLGVVLFILCILFTAGSVSAQEEVKDLSEASLENHLESIDLSKLQELQLWNN